MKVLIKFLSISLALVCLSLNAYTTDIKNNSELAISISTTNESTCNGMDGSVTVHIDKGTPNYSFVWDHGEKLLNTSSTTHTIDRLSEGFYYVTVTDGTGQTIEGWAIVDSPPVNFDLSIAATNVSCFGASDGEATVTVSGTSGPYTYRWTDGQASATATNLSAGFYVVWVTDTADCTLSRSIRITEPSEVLVMMETTSPISCNGGSDGSIIATASGGYGTYTYSWNPSGVTSDIASNLSAGMHTVTVTDQNGCTTSAALSLTEPDPINITLAIENPISCFGMSDGRITTSVSGGVAPYQFLWNNNATTPSVENLAAGLYEVTVTGDDGCSNKAEISLDEPAELSAAVSVVADVSCYQGSDGSLMAIASGGTEPYSFSWDNTATGNMNQDLPVGTYQVTVADKNNCTAGGTGTIMQPELLTLQASVEVRYEGGDIDLTASGGTPPYTFSWSNGAVTEDLTDIPSGIYTVEITDEKNCYQTLDVVIDLPTSVNEKDIDRIKVYPNPARDRIFLTVQHINAPITADIISANGKVVRQINISYGQPAELRTRDLPAGIYYLRVADSGRLLTEKIIIR